MLQQPYFKPAFIYLCTILCILSASASPISSSSDNIYKLDSSASISLLTCDPGNEMYSTFGHSAFFIKDTVTKVDRVYNYGTFSYDDDFLYKFITGDLDYFLSISNLDEFMWEYEMDNRGVTQQILHLNQSEKEKLYQLLEENYLPENRVYHYDFLFDNCSTRLRDILEKATGKNIEYDFSFITKNAQAKNQSYRNMIDECAGHLKWLTFGMDLMIGVPSDKIATPREHLFLPNNLMTAYFFASTNNGNRPSPLVANTKTILHFDAKKEATPFFQSPLFVFSLFFLLVLFITFYEFKKEKWLKAFDIGFSLLFSLIGCLFVFMWTSTRHHVAYVNLNLLWANPFVIIGCILFFTKKYRLISWFALVYCVMSLCLLLSWRWLLPQDFNIAMMPLFLALTLRSGYIFYYSRNKLKRHHRHG